MLYQQNLGFEKVVDVNGDFTKVQLKASDEAGRSHVLHIQIKPGFPTTVPLVTAEFPSPLEIAWARTSSIADIYQQFTRELQVYQEYWDDFDVLSENVCIMEPEKPNYSTTKICISIGEFGYSFLLSI